MLMKGRDMRYGVGNIVIISFHFLFIHESILNLLLFFSFGNVVVVPLGFK